MASTLQALMNRRSGITEGLINKEFQDEICALEDPSGCGRQIWEGNNGVRTQLSWDEESSSLGESKTLWVTSFVWLAEEAERGKDQEASALGIIVGGGAV